MEEQKYIIEEGSKPIPCEMYIRLSVFSDEKDFNPNELTQILRIEPTATWHKDDLIRKNLYRKETCWCLKTTRVETFDFEEVFHMFMNVLTDKMYLLGNYARENNLFVKIVPVIVVSNNMPWIVITKEIADALLLLNATIEFDMYFA